MRGWWLRSRHHLTVGGALFDFGADFGWRIRKGGKCFEVQIPHRCGISPKLRRYLHVIARGRVTHPELGLNPRQKIAMAERLLLLDQFAANLDDGLGGHRGSGGLRGFPYA